MQSSLRVQAFGSATSAAAQRRCVVRASAPASRSVQAVTCSLTSAAAGTFAPRAASQLATRPARSFGVTRSARSVSVRAEISYVMVKPDGVQRGLVGEIISRFERKGFKLRALKLYQTPKEVAEEHYKDLASKPFYGALVQYILSGPVCCMVWEGNGVVASARKIIGATNPLASEPGTIRGDFAIEVGRNVIHGSDSPENGERETALWFKEGLVSWNQTMTPWLKE